MLTSEQKAEAEKKLKNINEELSNEEEVKSKIKKSVKIINDTIASLKTDPKKQIEFLKSIANQSLPNTINLLERTSIALTDVQEKMKTERQKLSKDALFLIQEKGKYEGGINEIKKTIVNIQKTLKQSVEQQVKKRQKIQDDLQTSLQQIRKKIKQFETESEQFTKENAELQEKVDAIKAKLTGIEDNYKVKAEEKDEQNKTQRQELTEKLKVMEAEVEKATALSKQYTTLEKKNFDNKIALYLKIKKFPEFFSSFESSADTLNSCKQELFKGVQRINNATQTIQKCNIEAEETNNQFLVLLRQQKEKEVKIEQIKKEKEVVRAHIIELQNRLKEKKNKE